MPKNTKKEDYDVEYSEFKKNFKDYLKNSRRVSGHINSKLKMLERELKHKTEKNDKKIGKLISALEQSKGTDESFDKKLRKLKDYNKEVDDLYNKINKSGSELSEYQGNVKVVIKKLEHNMKNLNSFKKSIEKGKEIDSHLKKKLEQQERDFVDLKDIIRNQIDSDTSRFRDINTELLNVKSRIGCQIDGVSNLIKTLDKKSKKNAVEISEIHETKKQIMNLRKNIEKTGVRMKDLSKDAKISITKISNEIPKIKEAIIDLGKKEEKLRTSVNTIHNKEANIKKALGLFETKQKKAIEVFETKQEANKTAKKYLWERKKFENIVLEQKKEVREMKKDISYIDKAKEEIKRIHRDFRKNEKKIKELEKETEGNLNRIESALPVIEKYGESLKQVKKKDDNLNSLIKQYATDAANNFNKINSALSNVNSNLGQITNRISAVESEVNEVKLEVRQMGINKLDKDEVKDLKEEFNMLKKSLTEDITSIETRALSNTYNSLIYYVVSLLPHTKDSRILISHLEYVESLIYTMKVEGGVNKDLQKHVLSSLDNLRRGVDEEESYELGRIFDVAIKRLSVILEHGTNQDNNLSYQ